MKIIKDDISRPEVIALVQEHINELQMISAPESKHALDIASLRQPNITFWTVWQDQELMACGALKKLTDSHAEIKSMRTAKKFLKRGIASNLLKHILQEASNIGYQKLSLETGTMPYFKPALKLYIKHGFDFCEPFASYKEDSNSVFLTKLF